MVAQGEERPPGRRPPAASRAAPRSAGSRAAASTSSTVGVTSTVRNTQACGAVATLRTMASAMRFWTPRTGALVSPPVAVRRRAIGAGQVGGQVLAGDDAAGTVAGDVGQVDPLLASHEAHGWRGQRPRRAVGVPHSGSRRRDAPRPLRRRRLGGASRRAVADQHRHLLLGPPPRLLRCRGRRWR